MLKFINVRELHNNTPSVIRRTRRGEKTVVTFRGKPAALVVPLTENQIEDLVLSNPGFLKQLDAAQQEASQKGSLTTEEVRKRFSK